MIARSLGVVRVDDRVRFEGEEHSVTALAGTTVRLRSSAGAEMAISLSALLARPGFVLIGQPPAPRIEPVGLLDALPDDVAAEARRWAAHVVEVETGLQPDSPAGATPRPELDPVLRTLAEREEAKAAELTAAGEPTSVVTVRRMRRRYAEAGVYGLVDQRRLRPRQPTGRADPRVVAAIASVLDGETYDSTGTRDRFARRVRARLDAEHGPGVVPLPPKSTFHRLVSAMATGRHTFGSSVTRRQLANRPPTPFSPTMARRPGELVQIDSTPLDVMAIIDDGVVGRVELTLTLDVATRSIPSALLRPVGTKSVDAALLLGRMLVPEAMRPGWSPTLAMASSSLPHQRLVDIDARLEHAASRPVIVPETIVCDRGRVFLSDTFLRACASLGISLQPAHPRTPTDKAVIERTFGSINTLFCQHVAGYTGPNVTRRGSDPQAAAVWTLAELQELLDEWIVVGWQNRPHDALRDPHDPRRALSPNDMYAAMVAAAGYVPVTLTGDDYLELLPVAWRTINAYGIQIDHRTYDSIELDPYRRQPSGHSTKSGRWEIHYDPYDLTRIWLRTPDGWITVPWTHLPMISAPFADFTWRHARQLAAARGLDAADQTAVAQVLDDLLTRVGERQPAATARIAARTRATSGVVLPLHNDDEPTQVCQDDDPVDEELEGAQPRAHVLPFGMFDARAEAERP